MNIMISSRLRLTGWTLALCGMLTLTVFLHGQTVNAPLAKGYTRAPLITDLNRAPKMQIRKVSEQPNGEKVYAIVFGENDDVLSGLTAFAVREKITAGHLTGIGGFSRAKLGCFDFSKKAYRDIPITEQVEVISIIGDVGLLDGKPQVHVHSGVSLHDGQMRAGHLLEATVYPTLEIYFTSVPAKLVKQCNEEQGIAVFNLSE